MGIMRKDIKHGDGVIPQREKTGNAGALSRLNPYSAYKDSDVEWLGEIPAHWEVKRLSWITKCLDGRRVPLNAQERDNKQGNYPYWGANSIVDYVDDWLFDEELVLIGEDGAPFFDSNRPVAFHVTGRIWVNNHMHVLRPNRQIVASFLFNALNCVDYRAFIDGTTRDKLTQGDMNAILIQCPSLPEQRAIAAFLDRETAKIDALVAKKERLIELLQEKRTALISHAVTKGLDPDVPLKDSGIEWLGKIPAHWEVKQLRWAITFQRGHDLPSDDREEGDVPVVSSSGISSMHSKAVAKAPGIVTGRCGTIGQFYLINQSYWPLNTALYSIDLHGNEPSFLLYMLIHMSPLFFLHSIKSAVPAVDRKDVHEDHTAVPHLSEQRAIAAFLDRETAQIDALVAKVQEAIDRLKELRTALISAAVTGKIDVREAAA